VVAIPFTGPPITRAQINTRLAPITDSLAKGIDQGATVRSAVVVDTPAGPALDAETEATKAGTGVAISLRVLPTRRWIYALIAVEDEQDGPLVGLHWARFRDSFRPR